MNPNHHAPFCIRGHKKEKAGKCPTCETARRRRINDDPVLKEKRNRQWRENKKKKRLEKAKAIADKLIAKADMLVAEEKAKNENR